ncbi:hypothetical protein [Labrys monachus]|uniref:Uncharacterized protein n=1 Tax=Labrys monachus TaxID=217067 RepID=A0ABU0FIE0_9HYPH|nr:hypothetical protein [Labrys monachus]MDQ0394376.1 hypothetical protein [Labrys monachus]
MKDRAANFLASLRFEEPPAPMTAPLRAIWHGLRGEWDSAHEIVQAGSDQDSAWVHAWLHRVEGDLSNARYWYGRAQKQMPAGTTGEEGEAIAAALLQTGVETAP